VEGGLRFNGHLNAAGAVVLMENSDIKLGQAGRLDAARVDVGTQPGVSNFVISFLDMLPGAAVQTSGDFRIGIHPGGRGIVTANQPSIHVGGNLVLGGPGNADFNVDGGSVFVNGYMSFADTSVFGFGLPNVSATLRNTTLTVADSGGPGMRGEYFAGEGDVGVNPTIWFPGTRIRVRPGGFLTVGHRISLGVNNTIIDTTGGDAVITGRLWGKALIKEGPGIVKLTRDNRNGGGGQGTLDGLIVRGGFVEFQTSDNLNDGGFANYAANVNQPPTGLKNIQLNGGGLRWAAGSTEDISARLRLLNNFSFDTNGNNVAFDTSLAGTGGMTKWGAGTLRLAPSNSYTGGTTVRAGMVEFTSLSTFGTGNVTLDGGGLRWSTRSVSDISARLAPLGAGGGTLETNGNTVTLAAAAITGAGSLTKAGAGTLNIQGTHPWAGSLHVVGGALNLSGTFLGKQNLLVGGTGGASLSLAAGTQLATSSHARIGHAAGAPGAATVSGANASLSAGDYLEIGSVASGSLHVSHGGRVSSATTTALGVLPGSVGTVDVTHPSSRLDVGTALLVGYLSTGILTVADGGMVEVGDVVELGSQFGGSGVLVVENGGTLRVGGANGIRKGAGASGFNLNGGTLQVIGGELTTSHPITLSQISTIDTQGLNATLGGILSGAGGISKTGGGILHLTAANTHAGGTQVHGGQIIVPSGSALGAGAVGIFNGTLHATGNLSLDQAVTVAGGGSSLTGAGFMEFGLNAASALAVSGGAQVTAPGSIAFGLQAAGIGQADVVGDGSWLACGDVMYVGYIGQGGVNVGSGGTVSVGNTLLLAAGASANGTFNLNPGGTLNIGGTNGIAKGAGTANFNFAGGLLKVTGSSLTTTVPMTLSGIPTVDTSGVEATFGGALSGAGNLVKTGAGTLWLTGANNLTGSLVHWAGTVRVTTPGGLPTGPLALNGGTLHLDFGDTASVQSLGFDGAVQTGGPWGGMDSAATFKTPRITGPGMIQVLSSSFPPAFNEATRVGLKQMIGAGTLDLLSTTGVSPIGGSFSGPGVSGNAFDPAVAGFGIHTITYTVGDQSAAFTISVIGGLILEQEGGSFGPNNLAPGGTAFAKDVLNHPSHSIAGLNNAQYGNSGSWIADTPGSHAGVALGAPHVVNRIAFGRDNTGAVTDRAGTFYLVQYTTDGNPASPAATWTSLGAVDYRGGGTPGISAPAARHLFRFPAVTATGLRVIPTDAGTAIDEIEIYPATGLFPIGNLTLLQEGGALASGNLAQAGTAFAQNEIGVGSHAIAKVNDGEFGNASSWIGGTGNSFIGINLGVSQSVSRIAFGRDNSGAFADRAFGRYMVQYTTAATPDASTPDGQWTTLGTLDYQSAGGPMFAEPHRRHLYGFPAVMATGLRIVTASAVDIIGIDEIEIYQASAALAMSRDGGLAVPVGSTVAFGSSHAGDPVGKTFTLANAGTDTLSFSSFAITGGASGDFLVTPPGTTALAPGQSTNFTVTFTPSIVGTRAATLQFTTNDPSHTGATLDLTGSGLAPTFNTATTQGLSFPKGAAAVDLATASGATPAGGAFSGKNVVGGMFDPAGLDYGLNRISYTRTCAACSHFPPSQPPACGSSPRRTATTPALMKSKSTTPSRRSIPGASSISAPRPTPAMRPTISTSTTTATPTWSSSPSPSIPRTPPTARCPRPSSTAATWKCVSPRLRVCRASPTACNGAPRSNKAIGTMRPIPETRPKSCSKCRPPDGTSFSCATGSQGRRPTRVTREINPRRARAAAGRVEGAWNRQRRKPFRRDGW
jgi:T5SS/PEP-CTERM-associated repeat protein/autotransporter-associated beta strand protein